MLSVERLNALRSVTLSPDVESPRNKSYSLISLLKTCRRRLADGGTGSSNSLRLAPSRPAKVQGSGPPCLWMLGVPPEAVNGFHEIASLPSVLPDEPAFAEGLQVECDSKPLPNRQSEALKASVHRHALPSALRATQGRDAQMWHVGAQRLPSGQPESGPR